MFNLSVTPAEFAIRAIVVYLVLLLFMRIGGKRQAGQLAPFDLVLLLIISNAVQNSMTAGDNSLLGGLISAMLPYSAAMMSAGLLLTGLWATLELPLGPQAPVHYSPPEAITR